MTSSAPDDTRRKTNRYMVVFICFAAIVFDGYDLIIYGSTVPSLLAYKEWALTPAEVGALGSYALLGMMFGALASGPLTDRFGRRKMLLGCMILYSTMMLLVAAAPNPATLGVFRFIAGLGFGGVAPVAIALVVEVARPHERQRLNAIMLAGFSVGGVLAALAALAFLDDVGFRGLWAFGGIALVTVVPLAWRSIPETAPAALDKTPKADESPMRQLVNGRAIAALVLFAVANFAGFLLVFGLNTWLPQLMRAANYDLTSALAFQVLLNLGAVVGGISGSALADRIGARRVAPATFLVATIAVAVMASAPPAGVMAVATLAAGLGSIGTQMIVFGYVATYFETSVRGTALGVTTGIGRLGAVTGPAIGGILLSSGLGNAWVFGFFCAIAILGGAACVIVPARPTRRSNPPTPHMRSTTETEPAT
ncbi:MFS transporter [Nonomuraea muscovyensis]|uniref:AAHS family benzoate transporter-like MFS transporter n=1 Tax=Nonomuraea muscovyensis TaxID=1124761 RepID=A0A7X0C3V0_9ACTN|nr:aromatic acid/H+ symport family MFS transporter [Nonomuraea muscovyensis]MBB6348040.1 AAHS family benzoate transporter-like MFS transporter [Nonomuraea muscovyensis]